MDRVIRLTSTTLLQCETPSTSLVSVTPSMRCRDENHSPHERQVFEQQRVFQLIAELRADVKFFGRHLEDVIPKACSGIDDTHFGEETALAVADHDHLLKPGSFFSGSRSATTFDSAARNRAAESTMGFPVLYMNSQIS